MTNKFHIARIITAAAVLVENDHANHVELNNHVLGRAAYLIQNLWQISFPTLKRRCDINDFWRKVRFQASRSDDLFELIIVWDETLNPPGCAYGENVMIQLTTDFSKNVHHCIKITAKKG